MVGSSFCFRGNLPGGAGTDVGFGGRGVAEAGFRAQSFFWNTMMSSMAMSPMYPVPATPSKTTCEF